MAIKSGLTPLARGYSRLPARNCGSKASNFAHWPSAKQAQEE